VLTIDGRHYPKCSCTWFSIRYGGYDDEVSANAAATAHVKERAAAKRTALLKKQRERIIAKARTVARQRALARRR
jgi:hypothetical protein